MKYPLYSFDESSYISILKVYIFQIYVSHILNNHSLSFKQSYRLYTPFMFLIFLIITFYLSVSHILDNHSLSSKHFIVTYRIWIMKLADQHRQDLPPHSLLRHQALNLYTISHLIMQQQMSLFHQVKAIKKWSKYLTSSLFSSQASRTEFRQYLPSHNAATNVPLSSS